MIITCTKCKKEIKLISFGNGMVGSCCDRIQFNKSENSPFLLKYAGKEDADYTTAQNRSILTAGTHAIPNWEFI